MCVPLHCVWVEETEEVTESLGVGAAFVVSKCTRGEYGCGSCLLGEARLVGRLFWGWSFFTFHRWTLAINLSDKGIVWFNSYSQIIGSIHFPGIDYLFTFISN